MAPFQSSLIISDLEATFVGHRLTSRDLLRSALLFKEPEQFARVTRAWIAEGIPFAYRDCPLAFEVVRDWVADRFDISARDVTVIGSVRLGYSASWDNYGRLFQPGNNRNSSDMDLAVVSQKVFSDCAVAFHQWQADEQSNNITVTDHSQLDSLRRLPNNIRNGFIDPHKIPRKYGIIQPILYRLELLTRLLNVNEAFPSTRKVSLRVYQDWKSFDVQMTKNIRSLKALAAARMLEITS